jgi:alanine-synthesizing transaminase
VGPARPLTSDFHRIKRLPPYVFEQVNRLKAEARARGDDIIDFGMGNPDMPTPAHITAKLIETLRDPRTNRYSASKGFANVAQAITAPGDVILVPNPTYPIHEFGFIMSGGVIRHLPARTDSQFMASLDKAVRHSVPKPSALVLNYPANPTAVVADLDFYREVVAFAKKHELIVLSDLAYAEIYFDGAPPPSILQIPDAIDIAVEFTTLSKTYAMPGWRVGFAVGNERLIHALTRVKSYLDYGAFTPIQVAAAAALNGPQDSINEIRGIYKRRRDCLVDAITRAGWPIPSPPATMFAWAPIPEMFSHLGSLEFCKLLLEKASVAVSPGAGFGEYGEGYVRIALVENEQRIRQAARNIRKFLTESATESAKSLHNVIPIASKANRSF